jgi:hypothetical protein
MGWSGATPMPPPTQTTVPTRSMWVALPSGPSRCGRSSPARHWASWRVDWPTAWKTRVMVPAAGSASAMVSGMRSSYSPSWTMTNWPGWRSRAISGASTSMRCTCGAIRRVARMRAMRSAGERLLDLLDAAQAEHARGAAAFLAQVELGRPSREPAGSGCTSTLTVRSPMPSRNGSSRRSADAMAPHSETGVPWRTGGVDDALQRAQHGRDGAACRGRRCARWCGPRPGCTARGRCCRWRGSPLSAASSSAISTAEGSSIMTPELRIAGLVGQASPAARST